MITQEQRNDDRDQHGDQNQNNDQDRDGDQGQGDDQELIDDCHDHHDQDDDDDDGDDEINYCDNNFCTGANAKLATLLIIFFSHFSLDTLTDVDDSEWRCN